MLLLELGADGFSMLATELVSRQGTMPCSSCCILLAGGL